jgi:hypothetical protein
MTGFLRLELARSFRDPRYLVLAIAAPVGFYLLFAGIFTGRGTSEGQLPAQVEIMVAMATFGAMWGALSATAPRLARDRESGGGHRRAGPSRPAGRLAVGSGPWPAVDRDAAVRRARHRDRIADQLDDCLCAHHGAVLCPGRPGRSVGSPGAVLASAAAHRRDLAFLQPGRPRLAGGRRVSAIASRRAHPGWLAGRSGWPRSRWPPAGAGPAAAGPAAAQARSSPARPQARSSA